MTTYYGLYGQKVQYLASDPTDVQIGQVWYNSTSAVLKVRQDIATNAWASGGNLNTARYGLAGGGTQTTAIAFAGSTTTGPGASLATEAYNGTAWTNGGNMNSATHRYTMGTGTQTAALCFGGDNGVGVTSNATEKYNGTTWTANPTGMNTARFVLSGAGTQTAALAFGGDARPPTSPTFLYSNLTESFNGTSWTVVNTLNTGRQALGGAGTQTAALGFGGQTPSNSAATESWNGTSWTTLPATMNTARRNLSGCGTQTSALAFGGYATAPTGATELWNGTSWATSPGSMGTARYAMASAGNQTSALGAGGYLAPGISAATEEWTGTQTLSRTVTVS